MAKKTKEQILIEKAVNAALDAKKGMHIENSTFNGVHFDAKACDTIADIARALGKNAEACMVTAEGLRNLSQVLKAQNVEIECMIKVSSELV